MATEIKPNTGTWAVKSGLAQMLKGGVIMDVVTPDQAKIAENAGAVAVMALERVPSDIRAAGGVVTLNVKVQCTDWIDIDRVQILVNGHQSKKLNFTRKNNEQMFKDGVVKFNETLTVKLSQDSHLIVVAYGENFNLQKGYGSSTQSSMNPCAYNNPIFVDVDGGGFKASGDTLGFPLPVQGLTADKVSDLLKK